MTTAGSTEAGSSERLTKRQSQVVALVAEGRTTKEVAVTLGVSERAVTAVLSRLFRRYGVPNRAGLIAAVVARGGGNASAGFTAYQRAPFMAAVTEGADHRYAFVNDLGAQVAGRPTSTIVGRTLREIAPHTPQQLIDGLDGVLRTGRPWGAANAPCRFTHPDGTYRDTHLNLIFQPIRDASGNVTGILHIGTELPD